MIRARHATNMQQLRAPGDPRQGVARGGNDLGQVNPILSKVPELLALARHHGYRREELVEIIQTLR